MDLVSDSAQALSLIWLWSLNVSWQ